VEASLVVIAKPERGTLERFGSRFFSL